MYRVSRFLWPVVHCVYPNIGVTSVDLHGTPGSESPTLENRDIRDLAANAE